MKTKRILVFLLTVIMTVLSFSGCSTKDEANMQTSAVTALKDLSGKKLGVLTSSVQAIMLPDIIPDAKIMEFNNQSDMIAALLSNKIDSFGTDESVYKAMLWEGQSVDCVEEALGESNYAMIFGKGKNTGLQNEFNTYLSKIKKDGGHDTLTQKWFGDKEPETFESYNDLTGENGKLVVGISSSTKPFVYKKNASFTGFEVELLTAFCREYGYSLVFEDTSFSGIISGVSSGKFDIGMSAITVTQERKESMDFSDVTYTDDLVMVIRKGNNSSPKLQSLSELSGKKIAVITGTVSSIELPKLVPDAQYIEFNLMADVKAALESGKVDAFSSDDSARIAMKWEGHNVERIDEPVFTSDYGFVFQKGTNEKIKTEFNAYLEKSKGDGSHKKLTEKWFGDKEPPTMSSYDDLTGENGTLNIGVTSISKPYTYIKNGKFVGYDIEILTGFAREYGYKLKFEDSLFSSVLAGVASGKYDIGAAGFTITEERKESVEFSDVYHTEDIVVIVKGDSGEEELGQFNNATLGVVTGSLFGGFSREQFPNAQIKEFNNFADVLVALKQNKVDGIMLDRPNFNSVARTDDSLIDINVPAYSVEVGFGFQKNEGGNKLQSQMNEFLEKLDTEGKTQELIDKWYGKTEPAETIPLHELSSNPKKLNVAIDTTRKPFVYMYKNEPVGFEVEVMYMFCKEYGYSVNISDVSFASGLAGLAGEKYDLVCGGLYMTPERKESVNFSKPYMNAEVVMAKCRKSGFDNFIASVKESFEKTFIREDRWKLIVEGVCTTLIISLFSVLGGTILGFALYMLARAKNKWISKISKAVAKVYTTVIAGTPTLVILMILFYVVFTSPDMSGIIVAIAGFVMIFGSFVYSNLALTVSGVDNGQLEAAYALGYSRNRTFFKIVVPQAMKMFIPSYSAEVVSLIKATSVVGYIAVNDLTKMGDIIRGNTYEAFFPLIAVALIYFIITWIITGLLKLVKNRTDPKKRKNKNILRGVKR